MTGLALVHDQDNAREESCAPTFDDFWLLYPKRIAKMEAEKAWLKLDNAQTVAALCSLVNWRSVWMAEGRLQFVPNASTWLNQQRWTDEVPDQWGASHSSHLPAKLPEKTERIAMPDHVRALIAKLRSK
jgi:hypothetical protein